MTDYESATIFRERKSSSPKRSIVDKYQYESGLTMRHGAVSICGDKEDTVMEHEQHMALKYSDIESIISNPICCGYLLQFCEAQHNSENVRFFLEVDEFRDMFAVDKDKVNLPLVP